MATWRVVSCEYDVTKDGKSNVVTAAHWECVDADDDGCSGRVYGSVGVPTDDLSNFTVFDDLTEDQVIGWVKAVLGDGEVASIEANVAAQIAKTHTPTQGSGTPWAA
ncbi:MAG: hypothetical protein VW496_01205 [Pelagibacteraceae bacterium]